MTQQKPSIGLPTIYETSGIEPRADSPNMTPTLMAPIAETFRSFKDNKKALATVAMFYLLAVFGFSLIPFVGSFALIGVTAVLAPVTIALTTSEFSGTSYRDGFAYTRSNIVGTLKQCLIWLGITIAVFLVFFVATVTLSAVTGGVEGSTSAVGFTFILILMALAFLAVSVLAAFAVAAAAMNYPSPIKVATGVARHVKAVMTYLLTTVIAIAVLIVPIIAMLVTFTVALFNTSADGQIASGVWLTGLLFILLILVLSPLVFIIQVGVSGSIVRRYSAVPILNK